VPATAPVEAPVQQEPAQQEAIAMPPMPRPAQPDISPLERAQAAAIAVPCAVLDVSTAPDGLRVSGFAGPGSEFRRLLTDLRDTGKVINSVAAVDPAVCAPITAIAPAVRQGWANNPVAPTIRLSRQGVPEGSALRIDIDTSSPEVLLDLYRTDGKVQHLRTSNKHAEWIATAPPGPRLLVAIASADRLDVGTRPGMENSRDYLALLRPQLGPTNSSVAANLAIVTVTAAQPEVMRAPPRPARSTRCANILSRAQLGETLSDAEVAALRTECRS
jgi:hypothetical protein